MDLPGLGDSTGSPTGSGCGMPPSSGTISVPRWLSTLSWHIAFHSQPRVPEAVVGDHVREHLALFYPQVSFGGTAFGGTSDRPPFTGAEIDEDARTYSRPEVLSGGFDLYRSLDQDVRATVSARFADIVRAVDVPHAGHWLVEKNPRFVTAKLLRFLAG
ncbi:MAG TPA: hypothetical protein VGH57_02765 [Amycolatopsis sp.]